MRSNIGTYLAVLLSALAVAALLTTPAAAKSSNSYRNYHRTYGPYTPSLPVSRYGGSRDFQNEPR